MKRETTLITVTVLALVLVGLLMVYSASAVNPKLVGYPNRQLFFAIAGVAAFLFCSRFDYHHFADGPIFRGIVLASIGLLLLVLVPGVGKEVDGGQRWIDLGFFSFQPSELAKFALILLLAVKLTQNREHVRKFWRGFLPPMLIACLFAGLVVAERDLGVPLMMMGVAFIMLCAAGVRWRYLLLSLIPAGTAAAALVVFFPHRVIRFIAFVDPWAYRQSWGWQLIQAYGAFARGGVTGVGPGAGEQKLGYLPAPHTDFIFSVIGEELGLIGTMAVVLLFIALLYGGTRTAMNARDHFGSLLAVGIAGLIVLQAAFIMAVNTGMLPTKGITLPFISYGGSSLMVLLGLMGILVNIGVQGIEPEKRRKLVPA
ncbi:MAG: putative lipid II flippase FtsW [Candidatus Hydrogenedentes bacterium]|nr:putative lipid II flippase FtsW [Candidatus Hydrogenedentota bacterium]